MKKYTFKPYNPKFPKLFEKEKERIAAHIGNALIEHIGSTALPGLGGKGIIDIAIKTSKEEIQHLSQKLQQIGYVFRESASTSERYFFRIDLPDEEEGTRRYHVHLILEESREWDRMILFREYLKQNKEELEKYADTKRKAAEEVNDDGEKYRELKAPIIEEILKKAAKEGAI